MTTTAEPPKEPKPKKPVFAYRFQFMSPTFRGWPDERPWTRIEVGPFTKAIAVPEGPYGPTHPMPQSWIDRIDEYLIGMVKAFEVQGNHDEAAWHRARTRSAERSMLVRVRVVPADPPAPAPPACEGVPLAPRAEAP